AAVDERVRVGDTGARQHSGTPYDRYVAAIRVRLSAAYVWHVDCVVGGDRRQPAAAARRASAGDSVGGRVCGGVGVVAGDPAAFDGGRDGRICGGWEMTPHSLSLKGLGREEQGIK